ncbi:uncharacterized protein LOC143824716 [Paroedura picta]|uniref:uncharacterized protein LOC143824716 n=1 Tax=Paroedura picta TaxID=143630 RepID=UPI004056C904
MEHPIGMALSTYQPLRNRKPKRQKSSGWTGRSRKADCTSHFASSAPLPHRQTLVTAASNGVYFTAHSSGGMKSFTDPPLGYDRCWLRQNSPGAFFGTTPSGEILKLGSGGPSKGPAMRPAAHSFANLAATMSGSSRADRRFPLVDGTRSLVNGIRKPSENPAAK